MAMTKKQVVAIVARLPDSLRRRRAMLEDTLVTLPHNSALRSDLNMVLFRLTQHELAVREFLEKFGPPNGD